MVVVQPSHVSTDYAVPIVLANATSMAVALPSGYAAGDVLLVTVVTINSATNGVPTPAPGWQLLTSTLYTASRDLRTFYRFADGTEGATEDFVLPTNASVRTGEYTYTAVAYRDAADQVPVVAVNNSGGTFVASWTAPSFSAVVASRVVSAWGVNPIGPSGFSTDGGSTNRSSNLTTNHPFVLDRLSGPGTTTGTTLTRLDDSSYNFRAGAISIGLRPVNSAPYAPPLVSPISAETIAVGSTNRFYFGFSDPDQDLARPEGQSKYEIRYRVVGAPTWTTVTPAPTTNLYHDFAAATFTTGEDYEWQVRSYDLAVEVGPWSTSGFFTGGTAPTAPAISSPTLDEELDFNEDVDWTVTTQTAYRVRRVGDNAGSPDTSTVYFDSGIVADGAARTYALTFPVNNRTEHIQVQVFDDILWSDWASVRVEVAYTPPPAPVWELSTDPLTANLVIDWTTPAPVGDEPTPVKVEFEIDDGGDFVREVKRWTADLPLEGSVSHNLRGNRDYELNVWGYSVTADGLRSE